LPDCCAALSKAAKLALLLDPVDWLCAVPPAAWVCVTVPTEEIGTLMILPRLSPFFYFTIA